MVEDGEVTRIKSERGVLYTERGDHDGISETWEFRASSL